MSNRLARTNRCGVEWIVLIDYLKANGHSETEGTALKATLGWNDYEGQSRNGTDDYGWLGLSSGYRIYWWSSSQYNTDGAWYRYLSYSNFNVYRGSYNKGKGFSARCLRD